MQPELVPLSLTLRTRGFEGEETMEHLRFSESLVLTVTLSCLLLCTNAVPLSHLFEIAPSSSAPAAEPTQDPEMNLLGGLIARAAKQFSPEILQFCSVTQNPTLCAESITPFLQGPFDPANALESEILATLDKAREIAAEIAKLLNDPATSKNALDALDICESQYGDMVETIKEAVDLVSQQNVVDAYYKFSSVISYKSTCDDAFEESPGVDDPIAQNSIVVFQLGGNCLAIMEGIVNNNRW